MNRKRNKTNESKCEQKETNRSLKEVVYLSISFILYVACTLPILYFSYSIIRTALNSLLGYPWWKSHSTEGIAYIIGPLYILGLAVFRIFFNKLNQEEPLLLEERLFIDPLKYIGIYFASVIVLGILSLDELLTLFIVCAWILFIVLEIWLFYQIIISLLDKKGYK